jgi:hypothetical protein
MMEWSPHQTVEFGHQPSELMQVLDELGYVPRSLEQKLLSGTAWSALDDLPSGASRNVMFIHQ